MDSETSISLQTFEDTENNCFGVQVMVYGLASQEQAERAMEFVRKQLCGAEKTVN